MGYRMGKQLMTTITLKEASDDLGIVLRRALEGEEVIIITRDDAPVVRVSPISSSPSRRDPGGAEGRIVIHDNFDDPLPEEVLRSFES
jgi:prevent-host-death family protein